MGHDKKMPLWVSLAYPSIASRKVAMNMILFCLVFSIYSIPWAMYLKQPNWISAVFLIDDWGWFSWSLATTIWYWLGMKWIDQNGVWDE